MVTRCAHQAARRQRADADPTKEKRKVYIEQSDVRVKRMVHPQPYILNLKTLNPAPSTLDPKPQTLNPKP